MAAGKKLINSVEECVDDMLRGFAFSNSAIAVHGKQRVVIVKEWKTRSKKVAVVSGGGSGHEPFCAGYVGKGMLTAITAGSVFASPPASNILHSIRSVSKANEEGVLVIIPNYTGDCLNFGIAVERARNIGIKVETVTVAEDCALLEASRSNLQNRRGMCGLVFAFKIAGAMTEKGESLMLIKSELTQVLKQMATIGVGLAACSLPGSPPLFTLADDEMEFGVGVHGEAGASRIKMLSASSTVELMLKKLIVTLNLESGDEVAVLINNLGGSSQLEQWIIAGEVKTQFSRKGINVIRMYVGLFMTSLEMLGVQVCVLKIQKENKDKWLGYLDQETEAPAWPKVSFPIPSEAETESSEDYLEEPCVFQELGLKLNNDQETLFRKCLIAASQAILNEEKQLNYLDSGCGDGDCGSTLRRLAEAILHQVVKKELTYPGKVFHDLANIAETCMGGTSGAIYSLMFISASRSFDQSSKNCVEAFQDACKMGIDSIMRYSNARKGDRTLLDSLIPAYEEFTRHSIQRQCKCAALKAMVQAAAVGCDETKSMPARVGRASYVNQALLTEADAGAYAVLVWLKAICTTITDFSNAGSSK